jgi:hypothetical protein
VVPAEPVPGENLALARQAYDYVEPWEEQLQMDIERLEELPDGRVLALMTLRAKGRESGVQVDTE